MKFRSNIDLVDPTLKGHLANADSQIDTLFSIEEKYLTLKAAKDTKWAILFIKSPSKYIDEDGNKKMATVDQRRAWVDCHQEWAEFSETLAHAEALFHKERHRLDIKMKYIDAAHLTLKVERLAIERGVGS